MEGQGPPPGWYPDPEGRGTRYWDGSHWTEHLAGLKATPPPPPSSNAWKFALAGLLLAVLAIGGCFIALDRGVHEAKKELGKVLRRHAITAAQYRSVERGSRRASVIERLGIEPILRDSPDDEGVPRSAMRPSCIYYTQKGTTLGFYEFCFTKGRLVSKRAY
jgi:hypothetical protein